MNILYCIPSLANPGGMERIITEKINWLSSHTEHKIWIVTTDQMRKPKFFKLIETVTVIDLDIDFNAEFNLPLPRKFVAVRRKLRVYQKHLEAMIREHKIDICISTGGKEMEFLQNMRCRCKKVLEIHFSKNFRQQFLLARRGDAIARLLGAFRTRQLVWQTKNLDAVVVITKKDYGEWAKTHRNIYQIYNFTSFEVEKPAALNNNRAIAVGKLDAQKGFDMLVDAWALKKSSLQDWSLHIFGQGEWYGMLQKKIESYGLEDNIFLEGVSNDISKEMLKSSMFLFSSRYEGFSLVFLEAMACGLPVISFDCPEGPAEVIENNDIGLLVEHENVPQFANAMERLFHNRPELVQMSENSFRKSALFAKDKIMEQWNSLFLKIAADV